MNPHGGLDRFSPRLHPAAVAEIAAWGSDPELGALYQNLDRHTNLKSFLDTYAEALVARHLRHRGCGFVFEVPTPGGKACDFEVSSPGNRFYLHVKRLDTEQPVRRRLTISSRLRYLERIERPYVVSVRWQEKATDRDMERLVRAAAEFIADARVGDELLVRDDDGREIGGVLIAGPWEGSHVSLAIGLPSGFIDEAPRMRRLLRRAYRQFMPRAVNVIVICSSQRDDDEVFESALLGALVERWDTFPPRGRRIAHGRAGDGLWQAKRYSDSRAAGWFRLALDQDRLRLVLLFRETPTLDDGLKASLTTLFEPPA